MASGIRLTYEYVRSFFEEQGCELLETCYKNARTPLRYRCSCGHESRIVFYSFKAGNRCKQCGSKKITDFFNYTQEEAKTKFAEIGCELLSEYHKSTENVRFRCHCGRESEAQPANIWNRKHCAKCGLENRSQSKHYMWKEDRELHALEYAFRQRSYKLIKMVYAKTGQVKNTKTVRLLGYTHKELQESIQKHENWEKVRSGKWHIDHIFPIKAFIDYGVTDLKVINALDNLRPIEATANCSKGATFDQEAFEQYLQSKGIQYETSDHGI